VADEPESGWGSSVATTGPQSFERNPRLVGMPASNVAMYGAVNLMERLITLAALGRMLTATMAMPAVAVDDVLTGCPFVPGLAPGKLRG
jgi:hypothetical protein